MHVMGLDNTPFMVYNGYKQMKGGSTMRRMRRLGIYMSEWQIEKLKRIAEARGLPYSEIIRRAVDELIEREDRNVKRNVEPRLGAEV